MITIDKLIGNEEGEYNLLQLVADVEAEKSTDIHILINSIGGDIMEAFKMYDYLLFSDKKITTECIGNCASSASVIFLAGDVRIVGCPIMIHNPFVENVEGDAQTMFDYGWMLESIEWTLEDIYASRTNIDHHILSDFMQKDTYISPEQAVSMGFATESKAIVQARITLDKSIINNKKTMSEKKKGAWSVFKEKFQNKDKKEKKDPTVYNMTLQTSDGSELTIDRTEGEPQVGDSASPDGTHLMPDGLTIVVADGVISEIIPVEDSEDSEVDEQAIEEAIEVIETLQSENEELAKENEELKEEVAQNRVVLNKIKMAGGIDKVLAKASSTYRPSARSGQRGGKQEVQTDSKTARMLAEAKEKRKNK